MWFWPYKGNNYFLDKTYIHSKTYFLCHSYSKLACGMKWVGSTKVQHFCWFDFVLSLTKEADRTDLKSKLLVLITKVIDHHINYGHLVYFGCIDFNHRLCIALSWLLKKKQKKSKHGYISKQQAHALDLHRLSLKCRFYKLLPPHAPGVTNSKFYVFIGFHFTIVIWSVFYFRKRSAHSFLTYSNRPTNEKLSKTFNVSWRILSSHLYYLINNNDILIAVCMSSLWWNY